MFDAIYLAVSYLLRKYYSKILLCIPGFLLVGHFDFIKCFRVAFVENICKLKP